MVSYDFHEEEKSQTLNHGTRCGGVIAGRMQDSTCGVGVAHECNLGSEYTCETKKFVKIYTFMVFYGATGSFLLKAVSTNMDVVYNILTLLRHSPLLHSNYSLASTVNITLLYELRLVSSFTSFT